MKTPIDTLKFELDVLKKVRSDVAVRILKKEKNKKLKFAFENLGKQITLFEEAIKIVNSDVCPLNYIQANEKEYDLHKFGDGDNDYKVKVVNFLKNIQIGN